ncbi:GNAT family N-acetyltransferase [Virgibacillus kimchii]
MIGTDVKKVSLKFYHPAYLNQLKKYYLTMENREFTGMPLESIRMCSKDGTRYPVIIDYDGQAAGYFVLHDWDGIKEYTDDVSALLLRTYSIDSRYQGMGMAKQSLKLLPGFVREHFPHITEIVLSVNRKNKAAQHVYKKCGFMDKGKIIIGRKGEQFVYYMNIIGERG